VNNSDRLNKLMLSYRREARRSLRARAYLAAAVMQVSAFEAGLQAMCFLYPEEVKSTTVYANERFRGKRNRALEFSLHQLINSADELTRRHLLVSTLSFITANIPGKQLRDEGLRTFTRCAGRLRKASRGCRRTTSAQIYSLISFAERPAARNPRQRVAMKKATMNYC